jgi:hypothetical protein
MFVNKKVLHKVQLVDGVFIPSEASDVISRLITEKISSHKLNRLSMSEENMNKDTAYNDGYLAELTKKRNEFKAICKEAKLIGKKTNVNSILDIEIIG